MQMYVFDFRSSMNWRITEGYFTNHRDVLKLCLLQVHIQIERLQQKLYRKPKAWLTFLTASHGISRYHTSAAGVTQHYYLSLQH